MPAYQNYARVINVRDYGALGDGSHDDTANLQAAINACFVTQTTLDNTQPAGNKVLYIPPGRYRITDTLNIIGVWGGLVMGGGQWSTRIVQATTAKAALRINGSRDCTFENFRLEAADANTDSIACDVIWDSVNYLNTGGNVFFHMGFGSGEVGLRLGEDGAGNQGGQCSETTIIHCDFGGGQIGVQTRNANCIDNRIIACGMSACTVAGIKVDGGGFELVEQCSLAQNGWDLDWSNGNASHVLVTGCRTESKQFIKGTRGQFTVISCGQANVESGSIFFAEGGSDAVHIDGCSSYNGQVGLYNGNGFVSNSDFGLDAWFNSVSEFAFENVQVGIMRGGVGTGTLKLLRRGRVYGGSAYTYNIPVAVSALPTASAWTGERLMVNNASGPTYGATVAGGGSVVTAVFSDGTNWKVG